MDYHASRRLLSPDRVQLALEIFEVAVVGTDHFPDEYEDEYSAYPWHDAPSTVDRPLAASPF